jgi:hypothetical protein
MSPRSYKAEPTWGGETTFTNKMNVYIPLKLQLVCNKIAKQVDGNEFSIFCKIKKVDGNDVHLEDFFVIPEQHVSSASIDYGKDPDEYVDVVIHRHPDGFNRFSETDDSYINKNFKCSLLYTKSGGFVYGIYNMDMGNDVKLRLEAIPIVDDGLDDIDMSNIKFKTYSSPKTNYNYPTYNYGINFNENDSKIREWKDGKEITPVSRGSQFETPEEENKTENLSTMDKLKEKWAKEEAEEKKKDKPINILIGEELEDKAFSDKKAFALFKKDYEEDLFNIKNELLVKTFSDAEINDEKLLELIIILKERIKKMEDHYDDFFNGFNEEMKLQEERLEQVEETLDGIEFVDDDEEKGKWDGKIIDGEIVSEEKKGN